MEKIEYKIEKDKDYIGKRFETYTIEKIISYDNVEIETRYRTFILFINGDINKVNFDTLVFEKPIEQDEWEQLPQEYKTAWIRGTMTEEIRKYGMSCLQPIRERKLMEEGVA